MYLNKYNIYVSLPPLQNKQSIDNFVLLKQKNEGVSKRHIRLIKCAESSNIN